MLKKKASLKEYEDGWPGTPPDDRSGTNAIKCFSDIFYKQIDEQSPSRKIYSSSNNKIAVNLKNEWRYSIKEDEIFGRQLKSVERIEKKTIPQDEGCFELIESQTSPQLHSLNDTLEDEIHNRLLNKEQTQRIDILAQPKRYTIEQFYQSYEQKQREIQQQHGSYYLNDKISYYQSLRQGGQARVALKSNSYQLGQRNKCKSKEGCFEDVNEKQNFFIETPKKRESQTPNQIFISKDNSPQKQSICKTDFGKREKDANRVNKDISSKLSENDSLIYKFCFSHSKSPIKNLRKTQSSCRGDRGDEFLNKELQQESSRNSNLLKLREPLIIQSPRYDQEIQMKCSSQRVRTEGNQKSTKSKKLSYQFYSNAATNEANSFIKDGHLPQISQKVIDMSSNSGLEDGRPGILRVQISSTPTSILGSRQSNNKVQDQRQEKQKKCPQPPSISMPQGGECIQKLQKTSSAFQNLNQEDSENNCKKTQRISGGTLFQKFKNSKQPIFEFQSKLQKKQLSLKDSSFQQPTKTSLLLPLQEKWRDKLTTALVDINCPSTSHLEIKPYSLSVIPIPSPKFKKYPNFSPKLYSSPSSSMAANNCNLNLEESNSVLLHPIFRRESSSLQRELKRKSNIEMQNFGNKRDSRNIVQTDDSFDRNYKNKQAQILSAICKQFH